MVPPTKVPLTEAYNTPHPADRIRNVISDLTTVELPACLDPLTQAVRLRLEAENPDYLLRPDMFVDVDLPITLPPAIAVPVEAVLDSGREKIVFVERGTGVFEARVVRTGWRFGRRGNRGRPHPRRTDRCVGSLPPRIGIPHAAHTGAPRIGPVIVAIVRPAG
jgi:hypothetical protein